MTEKLTDAIYEETLACILDGHADGSIKNGDCRACGAGPDDRCPCTTEEP